MKNLSLEKLCLDDIDEIVALENECFSNFAWSKQMFVDEFCDASKHYIIAKIDGVVIGYGGVAQIMDEGHIMNIAVSENFRGRGIGKSILMEICRLLKGKGVNSFTLEVRESNIPAINLYENFGFKVLGRRPKYYGEDAALIYWLREK